MKTEKKYLMYGIGLVLLTLIGVSLAYFITEITGDSKSVSVSTGDLRIVFTNGEDITATNIEPGWSVSKTFSVENKTNSEYKYDIVIEDLVNTFKTTGYLVYKISSSDGGYNMTEYKDVPKSSTATDTVLAYSTSIASKATHTYTIEIKYLNSTTVDQSEDMNSTLSGNLYISKGTTEPTLANVMLRDNPTISERTDFSVTNVANTTGTIYKTNKTEDGNYVYYYSGNTTNNWIKFGKYTSDYVVYKGYYSETSTSYREYDTLEACNSASNYNYNCTEYKYANANDDMYWRIIRTNIDGSVRLLYAGTSPDTTEGYIGKSAFNSAFNESRYAGYMYGGNTSLADNRTNTTSSTIKGVIDTWYQNNLLESYDKYISKTAIYCNDRSVGEGTWSNDRDTFYYGAYTRLSSNKAPNYKCGANASGGLFETTQATADKFSASTTGGGNGQLTYPIALMTADEVSFAGGVYNLSLSSPYAWYCTNSTNGIITSEEVWWLLSPNYWYSSLESSSFFSVGEMIFSFKYSDGTNAVRPVISIDPCAKVTGSGTATDPYIINESASTCS